MDHHVTWPPTIVVAIPTVPIRRAAPLAATLAQWRALGAEPVVHRQDPSWPIGHQSNRRSFDLLLRAVVDTRPDATHVLLSEDDIDLHPDLPRVLPTLLDYAIVTLTLSGTSHYPKRIRDRIHNGQPLPRTVVPITGQATWWGSQGMLLPRDTVQQVLQWQSDKVGWDMHLLDWAQHHRVPIHVAVPNLVQHRGIPSLVSERGGIGRSATYGWPVEGDHP